MTGPCMYDTRLAIELARPRLERRWLHRRTRCADLLQQLRRAILELA